METDETNKTEIFAGVIFKSSGMRAAMHFRESLTARRAEGFVL